VTVLARAEELLERADRPVLLDVRWALGDDRVALADSGSMPPWPTCIWNIMSWSSWSALWQCSMYFPGCGPNLPMNRIVSFSPR
jgi:hypothetical protein